VGHPRRLATVRLALTTAAGGLKEALLPGPRSEGNQMPNHVGVNLDNTSSFLVIAKAPVQRHRRALWCEKFASIELH
jgi:hypothetical protein